MRLTELYEEFVTYQMNMGIYVNSTGAAVRSDFRGLVRFAIKEGYPDDLSAFSPRLIGDYLASNRQRVAGTTLKRWMKSFNAGGKWAVGRGILDKNPMDAIRVGWVPTHRREFMFEAMEAQRFLNEPIRTRLLPEVDQVLRNLLVFGGLRRSELLKLHWQHVNLRQDALFIYDSKNTRRKGHPDNLDRVVPICEPLKAVLIELRKLVNPAESDPVLFSRAGKSLPKDLFYEHFHALRVALGWDEEFVPHSLRHSLASNLVAMGATMADVALLLGHSSAAPDGRRTVTDGYVTSSVVRVRSFIARYAHTLTLGRSYQEASLLQSDEEKGVQTSDVVSTAKGSSGRRNLTLTHHQSRSIQRDSGGFGVPDAPSSLTYGPGRGRGVPTPVTRVSNPSSYTLSERDRLGSVSDRMPVAPDPHLVADAAALWKSLYPDRELNDPAFLHFLQALTGTGPPRS